MERQGYLDGIKAMGALMIVSLHTMSSTMNAGGFYISDAYSKGAWILHQFLFAAVPMFIMATGAGFLADGRLLGYREMKGHIGKIVCCICFFGSAFYMIRMLVEGEAFGAASLVRAVLEDYTWSHMWYLYRLLGLYLCMPLLSAFMWGGRRWDRLALAGILLTFTCIYPYVCGRIGLYPAKIMHFSDTWMFYAVAGGYLGSLPQQSCKKGRWIPGLGVALGILGVYHYGAEGYTLNEEHPALLLLAVSIFAMGKCMAGGKASPAWLAALVKTMLGVYIIHPVYIHLCLRLVKFNPQHHMPALTLPLTVAAIYAMSVMTVHLLRRIPPVRKYLL